VLEQRHWYSVAKTTGLLDEPLNTPSPLRRSLSSVGRCLRVALADHH
jgi:hypothetical protein